MHQWKDRALGIGHQFLKYEYMLNPVIHLTSVKYDGFGCNELRCAIYQSILEAPTRKVIQKEGHMYYLLENNDTVVSQEERDRYKLIVKDRGLMKNDF